jgi:hypothetical protein
MVHKPLPCIATYFSATREEMIMAEETLDNVLEINKGGYLAALGVYHELHCLVSYTFVPVCGRD